MEPVYPKTPTGGFLGQSPSAPESSRPSQPPPQPVVPLATQKGQLKSVGQLLKEAWRVFRSKFRVLLSIMLVPFFFVLVLVFFQEAESVWGIVAAAICSLLSFVVSLAITPTLIYAVEEDASASRAYRKGFSLLVPFIWLHFLKSLTVGGGFYLLAVPGFIFSVWFFFAFYVLVIEGKRGFSAFWRSKHLVSGNFWRVFWRIFCLGLIIMAMVFIIIVPISILACILGMMVFKNIIIIALASLLMIIFMLLIAPFSTIYNVLLFNNLRTLRPIESYKEPTGGTKAKYILIGIVGIILFGGIVLGAIALVTVNGAKNVVADMQIKSEMNSIMLAAEVIRVEEGDYSNVNCYSDERIQGHCENIRDIVGSNLVVRSDPSRYCAYVELVSDVYFCIDATGREVETSINPSDYGYCDGENFVCPDH